MSTSNFLTKDEALGFLAEKLHISFSGPDACRPSRELLQQICSAYCHEIPFTTVYTYNIPAGQRRAETHDEIKRRGLQGVGGLCYYLNVFLHWILVEMGFKVHFQTTTIFSATDNGHLVNIVHLEEDGKRYLIDGSCMPFTSERLICLDFEGPISPTILQTIHEVRVVHQLVDGPADQFAVEFRWANGTGLHPAAKVSADGWIQAIHFPIKYRSLEELPQVLQLGTWYDDPTGILFFSRLFTRRFKAGKIIMVRDTMLTLQDETRKRIDVPITSRRQWLSVMAEHFGDVISMEDLQRTMENYIRLTASTELPDGFCEI
ncbi:hypothetical protein BV898_08678 [Hypsibius exemplaris]|uniref:arylamine N-acetyltransferase n=1 Tax=Hypsibius exemplaris TaxID=2072580 RepID=A0A1W0WPZ2_HYPEX|nr:hypothetical protein BV898_08678 [Hypsibius exemplaris]